MHTLRFTVLLMAVTACGEGEVAPPPPNEACGPDQPGFSPDLVGSWLIYRQHIQEILAFTEDCKLTRTTRALVHGSPWGTPVVTEGTYRFEQGELVTTLQEADRSVTVDSPFHVSAQRLLIAPYLPVGEHSGIVGEWSLKKATTTVHDSGQTVQETRTAEYQFTSSGTYTWHQKVITNGSESEHTQSGTYEPRVPGSHDYMITPSGQTGFRGLFLVDDQALVEIYGDAFGRM